MKITRKQLKNLIKESMKSMVIEPNMTTRGLHHSLQVDTPPLDPIKGSNLDDKTLKKLSDLRSSGYEGSRQTDEFIDMFDPDAAAPPFGMKGKSYTDQKMMYDKIHDPNRGGGGIVYLHPGDSPNPNIHNAAYYIDNMLHDAGLGWSDGHEHLKINQLLTNINYHDHDKAILKIKNYLNPPKEDKKTKAEVKYIMANHPEIMRALKEFADDLEAERKEAFERYHKS